MSVKQFLGLYRGKVVNSADPSGLGRIRALVPQVMGSAESAWATPTISSATTRTIPAPGDIVWVSFDGGDPNRPIYMAIPSGGVTSEELSVFQSQVPSVEELFTTTTLSSWLIGTTPTASFTSSQGFTASILIAPFSLTILSIMVAWEYWTIAASDTNYWRFGLQATTSTGTVEGLGNSIRTQTTPTGGIGSITNRKAYTFPSILPTVLNAGDLLQITHGTTGAPGNLTLPETFTIRYSPA